MARARAEYRIVAKDETRRGIDSARRGFLGLDRAAAGLAARLVPLIGAVGLGALAKKALDAADNIQKLAIETGASTEALSEYQFVVSQTGTTLDRLTDAWFRQSRNIAEAADGTGEARDALERLGLSARALVDLRPEDQFEAIAEAMEGLTSASARAQTAQELFGRGGAEVLRILDAGADGIRAYREEARKMGLTLSRDQADAAAAANDEMDRLATTIGVGLRNALLELSPIITTVVQGLNSVIPPIAAIIRQVFGLKKSIGLLSSEEVTAELGAVSREIQELEARQQALINDSRAALDSNRLGLAAAWNEDINEIQQELVALYQREQELREKLRATSVSPQAAVIRLTEPNRTSAARSPAAAPTIREELPTFVDIEPMERLVSLFADGTGAAYEWNDLLEAQGIVLDGLKTDQDRVNEATKLYQLLVEQGLITNEQRIQALENLRGELKASADETSNAANELGFTFSSAFEDAILEGEKLRDVINALAEDIARVILRRTITQPIAEGIGAGISGLFPGFAAGGRPGVGRVSLVGERGPELFVPDTAGTILPNGQGIGGTSLTVNYAPQVTAFGPADTMRALQSPEARQTIVNTITGAFARVGQRPGIR